ncbi:MAG TPA: 4Fe-4S binding protein [Natronincola sp.]|nr:4Fe-4S binding protein [Natronincola sp.]
MIVAKPQKTDNKKIAPRTWVLPLILWALFEAIAITLWLSTDKSFYLFNFSYIGTCLSLGIFLYANKVKGSRHIVQFAIGSYMLVYLGVLSNENMQIEGFWYYLFSGVLQAAVIHYAVAKIFGPLLFGRGWCGYACWTAMVLDLLPFKKPKKSRRNLGFIRYLIFAISFLFVSSLFLRKVPELEKIMAISFIVGNILYYAVGITLAFVFKDNRAFCKYICPVTIFLKPASYYSLLRVKVDPTLCIDCGKCTKVCPMDVDVPNNSRKKLNGTECILCLKCIEKCPPQALRL